MAQQNHRSDLVLEFVRCQTQAALAAEPAAEPRGCTALEAAAALSLDRANASKELNSLYRAGLLIKRQGKPTCFLHKNVLSDRFPEQFFPATLPAGGVLCPPAPAPEPQPAQPVSALEQSIGAAGSLAGCIEQAKAALSYPPRGLHTLITGPAGVGKIHFAQLMYEYALQKGKLAPGAKLLTFHCQDTAGSAQLSTIQLFGCCKGSAPGTERSLRGLVEQAAGGILYLDDIHKLPPKALELLIVLLEKNTFCRVGETSITRQADLMILAASTEAADSPFIQRLARSIPVHICLPELGQRSPRELLEHLLLFFSREAGLTKTAFRIQKDVLTALVFAPCPGQIGEMKSRVKIICSRAFLEFSACPTAGSMPEIGYRHLPAELLKTMTGQAAPDPELAASLSLFPGDTVLFSPGEACTLPAAPEKFSELLPGEICTGSSPQKLDDYISHCVKCLRNSHRGSADFKGVSPVVELCLREVLCRHEEYRFLLDEPGLFYGVVLHLTHAVERALQGQPAANRSGSDVSLTNPQQYAIAKEVQRALTLQAHAELPAEEVAFLALYLYLTTKWVSSTPVRVLVAAHGDGIAEATAAYLNETLHDAEAVGLSFSPDLSLDTFLARVCDTAQKLDEGAGILIFADFAPLTALHSHILSATGIQADTVCGAGVALMSDLAAQALRGGVTPARLAGDAALAVTASAESAVLPELGSPFLTRIIDEILSTSLTFLNPRKAAEALLTALNHLLAEFRLPYSDEIAIKFVFHCSHMLERVIRGDALRYAHLKGFMSQNQALMPVLSREMSLVGDTFGIFIPDCELAYVAEIFLPFLERANQPG